jgi:hypothetical protein
MPEFKAIDYIERKKAGMIILSELAAKELENEAKRNAPWTDRTSHARQGLHGGTEAGNNEYSIFLSHSVDYGEILEEGSKPHIIRAKNKKALYWRGAKHPVKQVNHPGTKGKPIIEPTINSNKEKIKQAVIDYWSD